MVRGCHTTCRTALQKAVEDGLIQINPADGCKLPPKKTKEMQVLSREEMQRFLIQAKFKPTMGKIRKRGTGCISKINDHLYEGRYSPKGADGKRISKNVYAKTRGECEVKLAELMTEMKQSGNNVANQQKNY